MEWVIKLAITTLSVNRNSFKDQIDSPQEMAAIADRIIYDSVILITSNITITNNVPINAD